MKARKHILVIDDDAVVGRSFDRVLTEKGYDVSTARSGEEGLEKIDTTEYDLVFTDIKMPGMDGLEVAERIRDRCPWTPVVVITGYGSEKNEAKAKVLGTRGFVRKPLTPEMIESVTLKTLTSRAAAARIVRFGQPSPPVGGVARTISSTPATWAGTTVMTTVDG